MRRTPLDTQTFSQTLKALCAALALALFLPGPAKAQNSAPLTNQGVAAYKAGKYEQALDFFNQAAQDTQGQASALYNQGTALYKLGKYEEASQAFTASAEAEKNQKTRAKAEYNKGRSLLAQAAQNQDMGAKKELLLAGNQAFREALRNDPTLKHARKGIEDFRKKFAKVSQQPPENKEEQQGQGQENKDGQEKKKEDLQNKLNQAGQKQQDMADQSKKADSGTSPQEATKKQGQDMAAQQQSVRQSLEELKKELNQEHKGAPENEPDKKNLNEKMEQAIKAQKEAEKALSKGEMNKAQEHQQQAADHLKEMAENLNQDKKEEGEHSPTPPINNESKDEQSKEEAKTLSTVADILDGEKALHEMRRLRMKQQRPTSGKDW